MINNRFNFNLTRSLANIFDNDNPNNQTARINNPLPLQVLINNNIHPLVIYDSNSEEIFECSRNYKSFFNSKKIGGFPEETINALCRGLTTGITQYGNYLPYVYTAGEKKVTGNTNYTKVWNILIEQLQKNPDELFKLCVYLLLLCGELAFNNNSYIPIDNKEGIVAKSFVNFIVTTIEFESIEHLARFMTILLSFTSFYHYEIITMLNSNKSTVNPELIKDYEVVFNIVLARIDEAGCLANEIYEPKILESKKYGRNDHDYGYIQLKISLENIKARINHPEQDEQTNEIILTPKVIHFKSLTEEDKQLLSSLNESLDLRKHHSDDDDDLFEEAKKHSYTDSSPYIIDYSEYKNNLDLYQTNNISWQCSLIHLICLIFIMLIITLLIILLLSGVII